MSEILAYDKVGTVRTSDEDGRLKISRTPISKANVCEYYGKEIPDYVSLGLVPDKLYKMYRDADELRKSAPTFNGLPILEEHFHANANNPRRDLVVGTSGDTTEYEEPYLYSNLTIWDGEAIKLIKTGEQRELSSCYRYRADMTPGEHDGQAYDGVMRDIRGSHIALVPNGRAGPDVLVADEKPNYEQDEHPMNKLEELMAALKPFLASDADTEACKKAMDEFMDDDDGDDGDGMSSDDDEVSRVEALAKIGYTPDEIAKMTAVLDEGKAEDEDEEEKLRAEKLAELGYTPDEIAKMCASLKGTASDEDDDSRKEEDEKKAVAAMDAAIRSATRSIEQSIKNLHIAKSEVAPVVGEVAFDSAESTYEFALKRMGVKLAGVPRSAYRSLFNSVRENASKSSAASSSRVAMDSKAVRDFVGKFPGMNRITQG